MLGTHPALDTVKYFYVNAGRISLSCTNGRNVTIFGTPCSGAHSIIRLIVYSVVYLVHHVPTRARRVGRNL